MDGRDRRDGGDWAPQLGEEPDERHHIFGLSTRIEIEDLLAGRPDLLGELHPVDQAFGDRLAACSFAGLDRIPHHERKGREPSFWPMELALRDDKTRRLILNNPRGARFGRLCFSPAIQNEVAERYAEYGFHRLPSTGEEIVAFLRARTCIKPLPEDLDDGGDPDAALRRLAGFDLNDVAKRLLAIRSKDPITCLLLMSLEFRLALDRMPGIEDKEAPFDRLPRGFLDALLILAEFERLADILRELARKLYRKLPKGAEERLTALKMLKEMTPKEIGQLASAGNGAARFLRDNGFHAETLYRYVFDKPAGISPSDPIAAYLAGRIDHDFYKAIGEPQTLAHRRRALEGSRIVSRGRLSRAALSEAGKREGKARQAQNRPSRPIDFFFGMNLVTTAAVGVREILADASQVRMKYNKQGDVPSSPLPKPKEAEWLLVRALLANTSGRLVAEVARLANRGRPPKDPDTEKQSGGSRFRIAGWALRYYLPPAPEPGSASRFDRACWLEPERDVAFWDEFQRDTSSLQGQRLERLQLWTTQRVWLMRFQRYFEPLRAKMKPSLHTAKIWTRWFSTVMPLNTDTVLTFLLMAARERGKRSSRRQ